MWEIVASELAAGWPDTDTFVRAILRLVLAVVLGAIVGLQRELTGKSAGLRTHILVSLGTACVVVAAIHSGMQPDAVSRVVQGLVTGIGFIGAGAILKRTQAREIVGLTTAAGLWMTASLGIIAGLGQYAVALPAVVLAVLVLGPLQKLVPADADRPPPPPA